MTKGIKGRINEFLGDMQIYIYIYINKLRERQEV